MKKNNYINIVVDGKTTTSEIVKQWLGEFILIDGKKYIIRELVVNNFLDARRELNPEDIYFLIRVASLEALEFFNFLKENKIAYGYLIDDNFWLLLGSSPLDKYYQNPFVRAMLENVIASANVVFCHSQKFKNFLLYFNNNIKILPTYFDFSCLDNVLFNKNSDNFLDEVRIGIVGNVNKAKDIDIIVPSIIEVLETYNGNVFFEFFGYTPDALIDNSRVRSFPSISKYSDFLVAQYRRGWAFGLAPLRENKFSSYKTSNKFREFAGCGILGIYSDVDIYRNDVSQGKTGWLVENSQVAWTKKIRECIASIDECLTLGENARKVAREIYYLNQLDNVWIDELKTLKEKNKKNNLIRVIDKIKKNVYFSIGKDLIVFNTINFEEKFNNKRFNENKKLIAMAPGEYISSDWFSPVEGEWISSMVLATFCAIPVGELLLEINDFSSKIIKIKFKDNLLRDGEYLFFKMENNINTKFNIKIINNSNINLGLYILTENGSSFLNGQDKFIKGRVFA